MKIALALIACCVASAVTEPAISQARTKTTTVTTPGRFLALPDKEKCRNRPKQFLYEGRNLFLSIDVPAIAKENFDWLNGRNYCREHCMDLVSLETMKKNNAIFNLIRKRNIPYIWTSGRICDFKGCEDRRDLKPEFLNGWFWSANRQKIGRTDTTPADWAYNPWSRTGHKKLPQPDNAEFDINETKEQCLSVLNNVYNDGIAWHDVACYHEKPIICEDSDELISYVSREYNIVL